MKEPLKIDYLCCPKCKSDLKSFFENSTHGLICNSCNSFYPVIDGLPFLRPQDARVFALSKESNDV